MRAEMEKRVSELETEYREGQRMLADLEARQNDLQQTLLRISGALQVLNELLAVEDAPETGESAPEAAARQEVPAQGPFRVRKRAATGCGSCGPAPPTAAGTSVTRGDTTTAEGEPIEPRHLPLGLVRAGP